MLVQRRRFFYTFFLGKRKIFLHLPLFVLLDFESVFSWSVFSLLKLLDVFILRVLLILHYYIFVLFTTFAVVFMIPEYF